MYWHKDFLKVQIYSKSAKIYEARFILDDENDVQIGNPKMVMLNRTHPWGFVYFLVTSKMLIFFHKKLVNLIKNHDFCVFVFFNLLNLCEIFRKIKSFKNENTIDFR